MAGITSTALGGIVVLAALLLYRYISHWRTNYKIALTTGFPVFYSPIAQIWKIWKMGHDPFREAGSDTFVLATPSGNMLWSSDDTVIRGLFEQHPKVDAPVEFLKFWNVWGPTIASVQGAEWKVHRKAVTAGFGPAMNHTVWKETLSQTQKLATHWTEDHQAIVPVVRYWTSRLALHIICNGFFGMKVEWNADNQKSLPTGHKIALDAALPKFIENLAVFVTVPTALLSRLPVKKFRDTYENFTEITTYLDEFRAKVLNNVEAVPAKKSKTILESVVLSEVSEKNPLAKESVLGNIFFTLLAGHETTGGTLGFIYLLMAIYPDHQKQLQKQLDDQLGDRSPENWSLEKDYPILKQGLLGAIQKEVLYFYNPASFMMRKTLSPVTLVDSNNKAHQIPENTLTLINNAGAARNPKTWKRSKISKERRNALSDSPALDFDPDRWLDEKDQRLANWTAFGAGGRVCPGKEFANIELTAAMATLFKLYSLELVVVKENDETDDMAWKRTRDQAIRMFYDDMEANITIGVHKDIPIRIVERVV
ncbi:Cytochrome P450 [Glarea lozoyensis ATCC 20868]|uniref:Cytochrome P450 n=1 Tax=Glarea lozoyensis (strain ATCC 20868 / MF5171) TaxID=1116229 RepID=S3DIR9_GLAL2|nr:Cytochrome P450 [Glarea lozoyensis ATCC 20868]EPE26448.1 Cytochrome P450 [Glarea lozoyensis ATCC 20868]